MNAVKKIGIIIDNELNYDIRVRKEIEILKKNASSISILCFAFDNKKYSVIEGVDITRIKIRKKVKDILFFIFNRLPIYEWLWKRNIKKFIINNSIDILHVHDLYMSRAVFKSVKSLKKDIPIILDLHENFPVAIQSYNWTRGKLRGFLSSPKSWQKKESKYLSYASKLIVLSDSFKSNLLQRYTFLNEQNIVAFPNVIDLRQFETFKVDPGVHKSQKVTLFYFGRVAERRGIFETLEVFKLALKKQLNVELLIIGPVDKSDKNRFLKEINSPSIKNNVKYIPWIDLSDFLTYLHVSDIFLSPLIKNKQHESGVANKIFQYMFGQKPILVSDCKPQKELVEGFECGLSYSNQEEYLNKLTKLVEDKKLRDQFGKNGFNKLYEQYDNSNYENILLSLYD